MASPDIFLSYAHDDKDVAHRFAAAFEAQGFSVWWDDALRSGEAFDQAIEDALRAAKAVVVLWSPSSVSSRWVRAEATIAERLGTFVPVRIGPCELPIMFELTHTADLSAWQGENGDRDWQAFVGDVRRMAGLAVFDVSLATPAAAPALSNSDPGVPQAGVLPFTFRGDGGELEFLAEDLTEDVTRVLAENDYFKVLASRTMSRFRGSEMDFRSIGRELDARYLVEGKLQKAGGAIRLTVELLDTDTANSIWSHRFAAPAAEIEEKPDDFARIAASEVTEQIMQAETKRALAKSGSYSGWERVLRAYAFRSVHGTNTISRVLEEARNAVTAAPEYGLAHAELAVSTMIAASLSGDAHNSETRREIREHVNRALQLDGNNGVVLHLIALASTVLSDGETCLRLARRLADIRPASPRSYHALTSAYMSLGRTSDAIEATLAQLRCKGFDSSRSIALYTLGWCQLLEGRVLEADEALAQGLALNPHAVLLLRLKAITEALKGNEGTAVATMRQIKEIEPAMALEHHLNHFNFNPKIARRMEDQLAIFRRLWAETGPNT